MEDLESKHRKEAKLLQQRITALKKSIGKGAASKEKKQVVQDQINGLESEMAEKHKREIEELSRKGSGEDEKGHSADLDAEVVVGEMMDKLVVNDDGETAEDTQQSKEKVNNSGGGGGGGGGSKSKKRKNKKMQDLENSRREAAEEALSLPNLKELEDTQLSQLAREMNCIVYPIPADGNCLFLGLARQLERTGANTLYTFKELRALATEYMGNHKDDFLPFLVKKNGDPMEEGDFIEYCHQMQHTAMWGGQNEIQALTQALKRPIHILQMNTPILKLGEEFEKEIPLMLTYHRHSFTLGEHYNSLERIPSTDQ